ncbi:SRPBCC family protein [Williamsia sp. CHRR-6]|uniref:SRPBCC family protein n=1 Tax=Williamsia sp. CHRR-6 TaxID=2835871 RepID=UPI001BDA60C6|nr:SRPBCC family protein [Williamsia sp. CHRR-6]MBT0567325.1 SRPBCC family protein [Williamsia sp. CHRR-6]
MNELRHQESIVIAAAPDEIYRVVSDVTRTGEWSPICVGCRWDDDDVPGPDGPQVGAWFIGTNVTPQRTWETRSVVTVADRPHEFAWSVGEGWVEWGYRLRAVDGGTELTERWHLTPAGEARFAELYGDQATEQIAERRSAALRGIPATLARIKDIVEADG